MRPTAQAVRASVVASAQPSPSAKDKARSKRTVDGRPVHSLHTLLGDLATIANNQVTSHLPGAKALEVITRPTPLQSEVFKWRGIRLERSR